MKKLIEKIAISIVELPIVQTDTCPETVALNIATKILIAIKDAGYIVIVDPLIQEQIDERN